MQHPPRRLSQTLALGLILGVCVALPARAQLSPDIPGAGSLATGKAQRSAPEKPPLPEPDAVPGAKARAPVAPATKSVADMSPTDALFDAINRGDITAARDALGRGADLDGRNILGMTPMELSVDLGRNDISFLLLSMRGEDSGRGSRLMAQQNAPQTVPKTPKRAEPVRAARVVPVRVATKPITAPKLFANDGGTPLPSAGFLGFGARQAAD